jgi:branched-chain amino acid transport system substrate-binding protein
MAAWPRCRLSPPEPRRRLGWPATQPIKIGLITDKTGALALYGEMIERSFLLGMEYAAGAPGTDDLTFQVDNCDIQILIRDDQSNPETTATVARELIEVEKVDLWSGRSARATATLQQIARDNDKILIVSPAAANEITGANFNEYTFRVSRTNYHDAVNQCEYMATQYETYVQIAPDYAFGWGGAQAFRDACTYFGGEFVADDIFAPADTTDFTPYMDQILASGAEAWVVTWAGAGFIAMMQAAEESGSWKRWPWARRTSTTLDAGLLWQRDRADGRGSCTTIPRRTTRSTTGWCRNRWRAMGSRRTCSTRTA